MVFFFLFLATLCGLLGGLLSPLWILLASLPALYLFYRKKKGVLLLFLAMSALSFLVSFFFPKGTDGELEGVFFVIGRKESYCVLFSLKGRYLCYDEKAFTLFSLVRIRGTASTVVSAHFQESFDFSSYLRTKGVFRELKPEKENILFRFPWDSNLLFSYAMKYLDEDAVVLCESLLFGGSLYDLSSYACLQGMGLTSILTLGGFHLSFLCHVLEAVMGKKNRRAGRLLSLLLVLFFLFLSNFRYAVLRLFLMRFLSLVNPRLKRPLSALDRTGLVAIFLLLINPYSLFSTSFLYSFLFLFTIHLFGFGIRRKKGDKSFFLFLCLFFLPMRLNDSYVFLLLSPVAQIALVPLSHLLFLLSTSLLLLPFSAYLINPIVHFFLFLSEETMAISPRLVSGLPSVAFFLLFYLALALFLLFRTYFVSPLAHFFLAISLIVAGFQFLPDPFSHEEVHFVDVGQGDCTLVRHGRSAILIDTGGSTKDDLATEALIPYLESMKIRKVDAVLLTHYDYDHYGSLKSLQRHFDVGPVFDRDSFLSTVGNTLSIDGLEITNLNRDTSRNDSNAQSGVYLFTLERTTFLIMGDAPKAVERQILEANPGLDVDVLKIGHHGSDTSSDEDFLRAVSPDVAILSVGVGNPYGHPNEETLRTLESLAIPYRRTDVEGTILFVF